MQPDTTFNREPSLDHYRQKFLGRGGQAIVYTYQPQPAGTIYAVKVLEPSHDWVDENEKLKNLKYIAQESKWSPKLQHIHLLCAHESFEYAEGVAIIMPYFWRGSLHRMTLNPAEIKDAVRQVLDALRFLHEQDLIHRDIKPGNILIRSNVGEALDVVVADYGLITKENPVTTIGTSKYMAPEINQNGLLDDPDKIRYSKKVDIYALGMTLLDLLGIKIRSDFVRSREKFDRIVGRPLHAALDASNNPNDVGLHDALIVAEHMLGFEASLRPSAADCLHLPWFTQPLPIPLSRPLSRAPTNLAANLAELSVMEPDNPWCSPGAAGNHAPPTSPPKRYSLRKRKAVEQNRPDLPPKAYKIQKRVFKALPTPRPTPENIEKKLKRNGKPRRPQN